jgi:hypothetical protein
MFTACPGSTGRRGSFERRTKVLRHLTEFGGGADAGISTGRVKQLMRDCCSLLTLFTTNTLLLHNNTHHGIPTTSLSPHPLVNHICTPPIHTMPCHGSIRYHTFIAERNKLNTSTSHKVLRCPEQWTSVRRLCLWQRSPSESRRGFGIEDGHGWPRRQEEASHTTARMAQDSHP